MQYYSKSTPTSIHPKSKEILLAGHHDLLRKACADLGIVLMKSASKDSLSSTLSTMDICPEQIYTRSTSETSGISGIMSPSAFSARAYSDMNEFGDLPTPTDRPDSAASIFFPPHPGMDLFETWDIKGKYIPQRIIGKGSYGEVVQGIDRR